MLKITHGLLLNCDNPFNYFKWRYKVSKADKLFEQEGYTQC